MTGTPIAPTDAVAHLLARRAELDSLITALAPHLSPSLPPAPAPQAQGATLAEKHRDWLDLRRRLLARNEIAPATLAANDQHLKSWIIPGLGGHQFEELTVPVLRAWARNLADQRAPTTVHNVVSTLRLYLDDAIGEGWCNLTANPAMHGAFTRQLPDARTRAGRPVTIPLASAQALVASPAIHIVRRLRYLLAFTTGARAGELAGLTWARIHLEAAVPYLEIIDALKTHGEGGKRVRGGLKTEASKRTIPVHPITVRALTWWRDMGWAQVTRRQPTDADPVLPSLNKSGQTARPEVSDHLRADLKTLGLATDDGGVGLAFRYTRGSFASYLAAARVPLEVRQRLMGHRAATVTEHHYTAHDLTELAAAVTRLPFDTVCLEMGPSPFSHPGKAGRPRKTTTLP